MEQRLLNRIFRTTFTITQHPTLVQQLAGKQAIQHALHFMSYRSESGIPNMEVCKSIMFLIKPISNSTTKWFFCVGQNSNLFSQLFIYKSS